LFLLFGSLHQKKPQKDLSLLKDEKDNLFNLMLFITLLLIYYILCIQTAR
jgi:hypothetical protein